MQPKYKLLAKPLRHRRLHAWPGFTIEQSDAGIFCGGWVTTEIDGPFRDKPETGGW